MIPARLVRKVDSVFLGLHAGFGKRDGHLHDCDKCSHPFNIETMRTRCAQGQIYGASDYQMKANVSSNELRTLDV